MNKEITAIVLAGGLSSRFGTNKALALWCGKPLVIHVVDSIRPFFSECIVAVKNRQDYQQMSGAGLRMVEDRWAGHHPLAGICAGLESSKTDYNFVCACDTPLLQAGLINALKKAVLNDTGDAKTRKLAYDAVVPVWNGIVQPLCAIYSKRCLNAARSLLDEDLLSLKPHKVPRGSVLELFTQVRTRFLSHEEVALVDPSGSSFININTMEDYSRIF